MDNLEIAELNENHLTDVLEIEKDSFSAPWSINTFLKELNNNFAYYLVALLNQQVISYIGSWIMVNEIHITTLATSSEYRNKGIATKLLKRVVSKAKELEKNRISLEVRLSNKKAQSLYLSEGFFRVAKKPSYYKDNNEDAVVMLKQI